MSRTVVRLVDGRSIFISSLPSRAPDSSYVSFKTADSSAATRTAEAKLREIKSIPDYTTPLLADVAGRTVYVPENVTTGRANGGSLLANYYGPGRLTTTDTNKRGKWFANVTSAPTSLGNHNSIDTSFNGDLSRSIFQVEHRITGTATLGQPTTGYVYTPEAYPVYGVLFNSSGFNNSTSINDGRTAACFSRVHVHQYGQGDAVAYNATAYVASQKAGATHFLAQPAVVLFNGDIASGVNYGYLNAREIYMRDNGFDVAAIGDVVNMNRTNEIGGQSCFWSAYRPQSVGTKAINQVYGFTGKANVGIDFSIAGVDFGANQAAVSLKAGQRVYLNNYSSSADFTNGFNGDYIDYSTVNSAIQIVAGGVSAARFGATLTVLPNRVRLGAVLNFANDAAAATGGLAVGDVYRNGSALMVRVA